MTISTICLWGLRKFMWSRKITNDKLRPINMKTHHTVRWHCESCHAQGHWFYNGPKLPHSVHTSRQFLISPDFGFHSTPKCPILVSIIMQKRFNYPITVPSSIPAPTQHTSHESRSQQVSTARNKYDTSSVTPARPSSGLDTQIKSSPSH